MGIEIGALYLRRSAFIKASPERIWQEFKTKEVLARWFGLGHTLDKYDPKIGGWVELYIEPDGVKRPFGGKILVFEKNQELSFENDWLQNGSTPSSTILTLRLNSLKGGTHVELIDHGYERHGDRAGDLLESYESGWDNHHLVALRKIVEET
jgi:uncharacterized protein YndB with AHSA1/START domain